MLFIHPPFGCDRYSTLAATPLFKGNGHLATVPPTPNRLNRI